MDVHLCGCLRGSVFPLRLISGRYDLISWASFLSTFWGVWSTILCAWTTFPCFLLTHINHCSINQGLRPIEVRCVTCHSRSYAGITIYDRIVNHHIEIMTWPIPFCAVLLNSSVTRCSSLTHCNQARHNPSTHPVPSHRISLALQTDHSSPLLLLQYFTPFKTWTNNHNPLLTPLFFPDLFPSTPLPPTPLNKIDFRTNQIPDP